jgi:hypothetical protein
MPLAKVKIHRLSVYLEGVDLELVLTACAEEVTEKVEYFSHMQRVGRMDPIVRMQLLGVKYDDKTGRHILPLDCTDVNALRQSPLQVFTTAEDDISELAADWMGPGPWTFHKDLTLPASCNLLHFTNKNKRTNICVTHVFKCVIRIERGDDEAVDPKTGKRKLFDIVVQTPVHILSVNFSRCGYRSLWLTMRSAGATRSGHRSPSTLRRSRIPLASRRAVHVRCYGAGGWSAYSRASRPTRLLAQRRPALCIPWHRFAVPTLSLSAMYFSNGSCRVRRANWARLRQRMSRSFSYHST